MPFREEIEKLFDLPFELAKKEIPSKLLGTYVKLNGELVIFHKEDTSGVLVGTETEGTLIPKSKVVSLEVWLPETGVYISDKGQVCFIYKMPMRQWRKSFCYDLYKVVFFKEIFSIKDIAYKTAKTIWMDKDMSIRYFDILIGHKNPKGIIECINPLFKQELLDWGKYEQTSTTSI